MPPRSKLLTIVLMLCLAPLALAHPGHDAKEHHAEESQAATARVVVGWGAHAFQTMPEKCNPPDGEFYGATHGGGAVDSAGNIYITLDNNQFQAGILVYNKDGAFVKGIAPGLTGLHSLMYNEEDGVGYLYAARVSGDMGAYKIGLDGQVISKMAPPAEQRGGRYRPTGVAVAPNGDVYLADGYGSNFIFQFDKDGNFIRRFGGGGQGDGQFRTCHGIAVDLRGDEPRLLICDRENRRLQYFTMDGAFISVSTTGLRRPCAVSFHGDNAAVAELAGRAVILDKDNHIVSILGDQPNQGFRANFRVEPKDWVEGVFNAPHGLTYTNEGDLVICEWNARGRFAYLQRIPEEQAPEAPADVE
ncbi:MAG: 6-bladed beta-propeller [Planctomycetota bacterium]